MAQILHRQLLQSGVKCPIALSARSRAGALTVPLHQKPCLGTRGLRGRLALVRDRPTPSSSPSATSGSKDDPKAEPGPPTSGSLFGGKGPGDNDQLDLDPLTLATATTTIEKISGALVTYGLAVLLGNLSGIEPTRELLWKDGAPLAVGASAALPVVLVAAVLFWPFPGPGWGVKELETVSEIDQEEENYPLFTLGSGIPAAETDSSTDEDERVAKAGMPAIPRQAVEQGLWLYRMHVLKPWFPAFDWSAVDFLFLVSCAAAGAQELLVRGYGGSALEGWYGSLLAGANDVNNPIYWGKVFKLVTPDTARWMAAFSIIVLQVSLSAASAGRAARFTRLVMTRLPSRVSPSPLVKGIMLRMSVHYDDANVDGKSETELELYTAEERVVFWASLGVSMLLVGATNCAWAASGSLLGSYTAQILIDLGTTAMQQWSATRLPERELWEEVRRRQEEDDEDEDEDERKEGDGDGSSSRGNSAQVDGAASSDKASAAQPPAK